MSGKNVFEPEDAEGQSLFMGSAVEVDDVSIVILVSVGTRRKYVL